MALNETPNSKELGEVTVRDLKHFHKDSCHLYELSQSFFLIAAMKYVIELEALS